MNSRDYPAIEKDIDTAIAKHMGQAPESMYDKLSDHYSLRGRVKFLSGRYRDALGDMELAIRADFLSSDKIFNVDGVLPEQKASKPCTWSLSDFATLTAAMPSDFRPVLLRGLYWIFFTTFGKEDHYAKALQDFQRAAALNPKSPLPPYFIGRVYTKRDDISRKAISAYTAAIQLDSKFLPAYEERASAYLGLKQHTQAIRDYDRILELDPENTTAYADRGLAELVSGISPLAIFDLGEAIRRTPDDDSNSLAMSHEYRADAYTKIGDYRRATAEYSKAIACRLSSATFLLSLPQIRALYPEYDSVSDEVLIRKLNALFWPQFEYSVFAKRLRENGKWQTSSLSLLNDLYGKRGDAYLRANDFRRGVGDFQRIFKGIPNFAERVERWRSLGVGGDGEQYFLDVKSAEFRNGERPQVWIKSISKDKKSSVLAYEADCKTRRLNQQSAVAYDAARKLVSSSDVGTGWQVVVPGTIGEQLYNGLCSVPRRE